MTIVSSGGAVASYTIAPEIENGLEFDMSTGAIFGTPTAAAGVITYTITATNASGTADATVAITVNNPAVPSISASPETLTATAGAEITRVTIDSSGGAVASYTIAPEIENGLEFDMSTGAIFGTPTAAAGVITYTITATNASGTADATVAITVNNPAVPSISASPDTLTATAGAEITPVTIVSSSGGAVASYSIAPEIENGLEFDTSTGTISGAPTAEAVELIYTITAINPGGNDTATVAITVSIVITIMNAESLGMPPPRTDDKGSTITLSTSVPVNNVKMADIRDFTVISTLNGSVTDHKVTHITSGSIILTVNPVIPPKATIRVSYAGDQGSITDTKGDSLVAFSVAVMNLVEAEGEFSDLNNVILPEVARHG